MNYEALRHFADSYGLAFMLAVFVAFCGWALRPGQKGRNAAAAMSIFNEDRHDG